MTRFIILSLPMELDYEKYSNECLNDPNDDSGLAEVAKEVEKIEKENADRRQALKEQWKGASKAELRKKVEKWECKADEAQFKLNCANEKLTLWKEIYDDNYPWGK